MDLKNFLAQQLNDSADSPSGAVQEIFTGWSEPHVENAIDIALCYVYSLVPQKFTKLAILTTSFDDCVIDFGQQCERFAGIVSLEIDGDKCITLIKSESDNELPDDCRSNSLVDLLTTPCNKSIPDSTDDKKRRVFNWNIVDGSNSVLKFEQVVPKGAKLKYLCASPPTIDGLNDSVLAEFKPLIADMALWWLFRSDTESRSNLARANLHLQSVRDFVETKLLLEFSLREDDYDFGRRKVDDDIE